MLAVEANSPSSMQWCLARGANAQAAMASGWRAVHLAVRLGHESCLLMLLQEVRGGVLLRHAVWAWFNAVAP